MKATVPQAKAALLDQLLARPELGGVLVLWGLPPTVPRERERVMLLDWEDLTHDAAGGYLARETYTLPVLIEVHHAGLEHRPVEERAWELFDALGEAVSDDPELDGTVWRSRVASAVPGESGPTGQGWIVQIVARVALSTHA